MNLNECIVHDLLAETWRRRLSPGSPYTLDALFAFAVEDWPVRFTEMPRAAFRARIAEETDTGQPKPSQHSFQFKESCRDLRIYLEKSPEEIDREIVLNRLTRQEKALLFGYTSYATGRNQVRRALRTKPNIEAKLAATRNKCIFCEMPIYPAHWKNTVLAHIVSLDNGGPDILGNTGPAHHFCNATMGTMDDYRRLREMLKVAGWPVDAEAVGIAAARAKEVG